MLHLSVKTFILCILCAVFLNSFANSTTWVVTTNGDDIGVCEDDRCPTLRAAINAAGEGDTVTFDASLAGRTIVLEGPLEVALNVLTIEASELTDRVTIDGNELFRVLTQVDNPEVIQQHGSQQIFTINNLVLRNGYAESGAGIRSVGQINLVNSLMIGNRAHSVGGGAIFSEGNVNIISSTISGNRALMSGGGVNSQGAVNVRNSTIVGNRSGGASGGGIYASGDITVVNSRVWGNGAGFSGGALLGNAVTIINSAIWANRALILGEGSAGAILSDDLVVMNSTISDNMAVFIGDASSRRTSKYGLGGAVLSEGDVTLINSRVIRNAATNGGGIYVDGVGNTVTLNNSTVEGNTAKGNPNIRLPSFTYVPPL
ncbi:MAG: hypothetical protein AAF267_04425 [Deinococcota bacterium]